jgi:hypothetical protein
VKIVKAMVELHMFYIKEVIYVQYILYSETTSFTVTNFYSFIECYNAVLLSSLNNVWKCFTYVSQCSPGMNTKQM